MLKEFAQYKDLLVAGTRELDLSIPDQVYTQLLKYVELLIKWNKVYSLTAITEINRIITHHVLDGLTIIPHLHTYKNIVDVGSGMGVPGVIIAICCPETQVTTVDINQKKCAFLQQVAIELGLNNLHVVNSPIEKFKPKNEVNLAISRAFTDSVNFLNVTKHLFKTEVTVMVMKAEKVMSEITQLSELKDFCYDLIQVKIPGLNDTRYLLKISKLQYDDI